MSEEPRPKPKRIDVRRGRDDLHKGPPQRSLRGIEDDLWDAAKRKAENEQRTVSSVVREFLTRWVRED